MSRVTFSMRLDEGLRARLEERAVLEGRSLANLIERLLELGLGQVVTERDGDWQPGAGVIASLEAAPSRSVIICPNERFHRSGVFCKGCERVL